MNWERFRDRLVIFWLPILLALLFGASVVYSEDIELPWKCNDTHCSMTKADFQSLLNAVVWMDAKIDELRGKSGCI